MIVETSLHSTHVTVRVRVNWFVAFSARVAIFFGRIFHFHAAGNGLFNVAKWMLT